MCLAACGFKSRPRHLLIYWGVAPERRLVEIHAIVGGLESLNTHITRSWRLMQLQNLLDRLEARGLLANVSLAVVYGSFASDKPEPGDIDLVLYAHPLTDAQRYDNDGDGVQVAFVDPANAKDLRWAASQFEGTHRRYGVAPKVVYQRG